MEKQKEYCFALFPAVYAKKSRNDRPVFFVLRQKRIGYISTK